MPLVVGEIIEGKYRIVRPIGEGGMGMVYEGENTRIKRRVAIKVLHASVAEKADVVQRFEREAQAAGRIGSDHIVEVLDLGNLPSGERFMVMEYLDGEDLTRRIKSNGRLTPAQCVPLLDQILEGLGAAHDAGIVHRDLKPDNIYILAKSAGRMDFVKLLDFGVSKFSSLDSEMSMTRTGAVMGTPYYMAPEQAKGGKVDQRSDLYSVGVVVYQMASGRVPFTAGSFNELLFKIVLEAPEPLTEVVPGLEPAFAALVAKAMHREPEQRFQSAGEFQAELRAFMAAAGLAPATAVPLAQLSLPQAATSGAFAAAAGQAAVSVLTERGVAAGASGAVSALGMSQAALSLTRSPNGGKKSTKVALGLVAAGIVAVGGVGGFILTRAPAPAAPDAPTAGAGSSTAAPVATTAAVATTGASSATAEASAEATALASASATPQVLTGPAAIGGRPGTKPPPTLTPPPIKPPPTKPPPTLTPPTLTPPTLTPPPIKPPPTKPPPDGRTIKEGL